jgi:CheY-like chemotaxis protein
MAKEMKKILVADDNTGIVASLTMVLQYGGYEVASLMSGEDVQKIKAPFPDLILLDIWMVGISGTDVCKHLKARLDTKHIPIIMFSAHPDGSSSAREAGANDFIEKPYTMDDMLAIVKKNLN